NINAPASAKIGRPIFFNVLLNIFSFPRGYSHRLSTTLDAGRLLGLHGWLTLTLQWLPDADLRRHAPGGLRFIMLLLAITSSIALLISLGIAAALVSVTAGVASWIPAHHEDRFRIGAAARMNPGYYYKFLAGPICMVIGVPTWSAQFPAPRKHSP
ncbi:MAG TPA: hypothetical protein VK724_27525, partial [Bryobacteraceae bacterium]|nr:hypothetical protein [Bryobacteraceae bacterium]